MSLTLVEHPLAQHLLAGLRDQTTPPHLFRGYARRLSGLICLEATRQIRVRESSVQTPLEECKANLLGQGLSAVPILRAGLGMLEAVLELFPDVCVGYVGLERNEETSRASSYYEKLPKLGGTLTLCLDPMLATGGSACHAVDRLKQAGADEIKFLCVVAAPQGVARLQASHPDVDIFAASVDRDLSSKNYILPGLGDFGDRLYGTP